ncbi:zinc finger, CCHC-type containing LTR copia-type gag-polypeptide [Tanacetum coccineum]
MPLIAFNHKMCLRLHRLSFSVYLNGVGIKEYVWEFGSYPKREDELKQEPKEELSDRQIMIKKLQKYNSKAQKNKKKEVATEPVKERELRGSHLLGYNEGYGSGLDNPSNQMYGRNSLKKAIEKIYNGYHTPETGVTDSVCGSWSGPLTVVAVMLCEAARFYPLSDYILELIRREDVQKSVPYKGDMPRSFANLDKGIVEELYKDRRWVILVLAVLWREKGAEEGKFSSSDPVKYEEGESSSSHAKFSPHWFYEISLNQLSSMAKSYDTYLHLSEIDRAHQWNLYLIVTKVTIEGKANPNPDLLSWTEDDQRAVILLQSSLTEEAAAEVLGLTTAHQIWLSLEAG